MIETEEVWSRLRGALSAFLRKRVNDEHLAEDLLQETFLRVHDGLHSIEDEERIAPWVFRVARNVLAAHARRQRPAAETPDEEARESEPEAENFNRDVEGWLHEMIAALPDDFGRAVTLAELEGLTSREIARELGLSVSGAKSRVQRGREKLRSLLLDCCHLDFDRCGNVVGYHKRGSCRQCSNCRPAQA